jgi:superfamily II DNA/RNA helicase
MRWKLVRSLSPADIWTALIARVVSRPAQCVHADALSASQHQEGMTTLLNFSDLGLFAPILGALAAEGYTAPTSIQFQAIPPVLGGRDLCGIAQTGTCKTAAFALPILQRLAGARQRTAPRTCHALVLSPTRELASPPGGRSPAARFGGVR